MFGNRATPDSTTIEIDRAALILSAPVHAVVDFMDEDVTDLVSTCIFSTDHFERKRASETLMSDDPELLELALASHILRKTIVECLEDPSPVTLSRCAELIGAALEDFPQRAVFEFDFLPNFLSYCNVATVVDMFVNIADEENDAAPFISHWMARLGVDVRLMEEFEAALEPETRDPEVLMGLLEVFEAFVNNFCLRELLETSERLRVIVKKIEGAPSYVVERQLLLCSALLSERSFEFVAARIPEFVETLASTHPVDSVFVATMKLVMEMIGMRPGCEFDVRILMDAAVRVWTEHQSHSLALRVASEVLMSLMANPDLQSEIVDQVLMTAQYVLQHGDNRVMRAFCYEMMLGMANCVDWDKHDKTEYDSIFMAYIVPMGVVLQKDF